MDTPSRWEPGKRATREQTREEWRLGFMDMMEKAGKVMSDKTKNPTQKRLAILKLADDEAEMLIDTFARAIKALTGRDMP